MVEYNFIPIDAIKLFVIKIKLFRKNTKKKGKLMLRK